MSDSTREQKGWDLFLVRHIIIRTSDPTWKTTTFDKEKSTFIGIWDDISSSAKELWCYEAVNGYVVSPDLEDWESEEDEDVKEFWRLRALYMSWMWGAADRRELDDPGFILFVHRHSVLMDKEPSQRNISHEEHERKCSAKWEGIINDAKKLWRLDAIAVLYQPPLEIEEDARLDEFDLWLEHRVRDWQEQEYLGCEAYEEEMREFFKAERQDVREFWILKAFDQNSGTAILRVLRGDDQ
ncbi:hypothetical protein NMY22_g14412 [Coprinellus aureogranulatus]|nr:hypothetical protein NMY22_g14412 [Coprinellus aureogranulatus]